MEGGEGWRGVEGWRCYSGDLISYLNFDRFTAMRCQMVGLNR